MSKKYGRQIVKTMPEPATPPTGFSEIYFDSANDGKLTVKRDDGNKNTLDLEGNFATTDPVMDGVAAVGVSSEITRADHVHPTDTSREPANANIQNHISSTSNPHTVTAAQAGAVAANTAITGATNTKITYDAKGLVTAGAALSASDIPSLDTAIVTSGVFDIARIPAAALERMVPVASQAARYALTTATVQLGDTVKQLDTGIMYVVIDVANLANAAGYSEYTAATAASVPWSGVTAKPTTLSGYGITDAATSTHIHGNITNAGAIGSAASLAVVTGASGVLTTGTVAVASGGTGATTAAGALTNLGLTATAAEINILDGVTGVTAAELSYVGDVTSAIQAQLNDKATSTHVHGNITNAGAIGTTAGLAVVTTTSGVLTTGTVAVASGGTGATTAATALTNLGLTATAAEINILDGVTGVTAAELSYVGDVTSAIQAQLNAKSASTHVHGNITNTGYIGSTAGLPIVTSTSGIVAAGSWYASTPATATTTGAVGASTSPARGDHAHPSRIAISAPASPVNGDIWMV